jgi:hypothetical protein
MDPVRLLAGVHCGRLPFGDIASAGNMEINGAIVERGGNDLFSDEEFYRMGDGTE